MKFQCPCGAKFEVDVAPGMPLVQFVCPNCRQDYSQFVNELIQRELGNEIPVAQIALVEAPQTSRLKISHAAPATPPVAPAIPGSQIPRRRNTDEIFAAEKKFWRKMALLFWVTATIAVLGIGGWIWYAWFASVPHVYFSTRFDEISHSGGSFINSDQIIFLHGGTLARWDMKSKKQIWSQPLVTPQMVADEIKREDAAQADYEAKYGRSEYSRTELPALREKHARIGMEEQLSLHVAGQNVWVANEDDWTRYDWNSGNASQKISAPAGDLTVRGNELVALQRADDGSSIVVHVDLTTATATTNQFADLPATALSQNPTNQSRGANASQQNPNRLQQQAQNLTPQGRIALPAVAANNLYEQRIEKELNDNGHPAPKNFTQQKSAQNFTLLPDGDSYEEFSVQLKQANFVQRDAMKASTGNAALENVNGANEAAAVNEQLNEMQRTTGGDKVIEDLSTYLVTIRKAGSPDEIWSNEVVGPPQLFALKTVNVLAAGKAIVVFDKSNKKLWQADLTYAISAGANSFSGEASRYGDGPCVERDGTLYIFDAAVLSAFDVTTGNARWRIPSVGIVGIFFDDKGNLYVNTTTGNPDDIKYSRQIDVNKSTEAVFMKMDPASGKILWQVKPTGFVTYVSGKFIYAVQTFDPGDEDEQMSDAMAGLQKSPLTRIIRLSPADGRILWQYEEPRAAMDIQCDGSFIRIIFKKEVEVLHYFTL